MASFLKAFWRTRSKKTTHLKKKLGSRRFLEFQSLEVRQLLSASGRDPAIIGSVFVDTVVSNGMLDPGEGVQSAQLLLFADNGNGTLGPEDTQAVVTSTGPNGEYFFDNLDPDTSYFVQQSAQSINNQMLPEVTQGPINPSLPDMIIDTFGTTQVVEATPPALPLRRQQATIQSTNNKFHLYQLKK